MRHERGGGGGQQPPLSSQRPGGKHKRSESAQRAEKREANKANNTQRRGPGHPGPETRESQRQGQRKNEGKKRKKKGGAPSGSDENRETRGGVVGLGWVKASPGRLPTVRAAFPAGPDRAAVPGCPVTRPTGLLTAPRPRGGARGREMPPCLCVCALVCLWRGGGGGLWHTCLLHCCSALAHMVRGSVCLVLQAPAGRLESLTLSPPGEMWAWARNLHVTRTCYPTTPRLPIGTGRRWYVARLGSDPHSLTALGTGGAATRAGSGSPRPRAYRGQVEGHQGAKSASLPWVPPVLAALAAALQPA